MALQPYYHILSWQGLSLLHTLLILHQILQGVVCGLISTNIPHVKIEHNCRIHEGTVQNGISICSSILVTTDVTTEVSPFGPGYIFPIPQAKIVNLQYNNYKLDPLW